MDAKLEYLSQLIIEFYDKISSWEQEVVKESGLSPTQMHAIEVIGQAGKLRMKELAEQMGLTTGTITVMVDGLTRQGVVEREKDEEDRRSVLVHLTARGHELFEEHHRLHIKLTQDLTSQLSARESSYLAAILTKMNLQI
ncbi:MAG: MarR family transcriptional regulator [Desulfobulbaceae bacterium]|mgnify:CR=1 FL=1|nr:MAG: MarR family transcriptional regulator [Desulfobulbaceae bacterium]